MQITDLTTIRLTADDLSEFAPRFVSAQQIYSPTAPRKPACVSGWREHWWLNNRPGQHLVINYWLFASDDEALIAADEGRLRFSARTVLINGQRQSIYQPSKEADRLLGDRVWQADHNFLFVRRNIVVLVAEFGKQVASQMTLSIARKILDKIDHQVGY
jgi:hypothetical protein